MKYDDNFFHLSVEEYKRINVKESIQTTDYIIETENSLLDILFQKFQEELKQRKNSNSGLVKIRFKHKPWQDPEQGFNEISELIKCHKFDYFASQYCMYLGKSEVFFDEVNTSYYEVIWDYKTYFEQLWDYNVYLNELCNKIEQIDSKVSLVSKNKLKRVLADIKKLPFKYQLEVLSELANNVEKNKELNSHDIAINTCLNEGHVFGRWEQVTWSTKEPIWNSGSKGYHNVEHTNWHRVCTRCGFVDKCEFEPKELIDERNAEIKNRKIKKLEKELKKLKDE